MATMSYSDDENKHAPQNLNVKVHRYGGKVKVKITFEVNEDRYFDKDEMKARMDHTAPWLVEHLYSWADFDQVFSINLFVDALHNLGKGLLRWDNHTNALKCGRRCLAASAMLKKAYSFEAYNDKSYQNWSSRNKLWWKKLRGTKQGLSQMMTDHLKDNAMGMDKEEYSSKMWKLIHERQKPVEAAMKKDAWDFIHKYIEHWWD